MGTLGGNLCLDTRCNYYNQNYEWRKAIDFCLKKDGEICWVATASKRCVAASSTDTAPALIALGATVRLVSTQGERDVALADLYRNDGIDYLTRRPDEILSEVKLPAAEGWKSSYWKLRRLGSELASTRATPVGPSHRFQCGRQAPLHFPGCQRITAIAAIDEVQVIAVVGLDDAGEECLVRFMHAEYQAPLPVFAFQIGL